MFMRYVISRVHQNARDMAYRIYVTDGLKMIAGNTARFAGGSSFKLRYIDSLKRMPEETRTSDEIIESIRTKLIELG